MPSVDVPGPPDPFPSADINIFTLAAGTVLHRIHNKARWSTEFNPCAGRPARFSPLNYPDGTCVPTAYAASTFEAASHESVFHDVEYSARDKFVPEKTIAACAYSVISPLRDLQLAELFEPDLNRLQLTRSLLIDTNAVQYTRTVRWALAIHSARPDLHGMVWTSRRCDPAKAFVLFGDRVAPSDFDRKSCDLLDIASSPARFAEIRSFGKRASIHID